MWYKNLRIYQITKTLDFSESEVQELLAKSSFKTCAKHQQQSIGWVPPLATTISDDESEQQLLYLKDNHNIAFKLRIQEKVLPSAVVKEALELRVHERELAEARTIFLREKRQLKDEIVADLTPKAFTRSNHIQAYWNTKTNRLFIDANSASRAEIFLKLLREAFGSLPVIPFEAKQSPTHTMTQWLLEGTATTNIELSDECELRSIDEDASIVRIRHQELSADEVRAHLDAGKQAVKLRITWKDGIEATLSESATFNRLRFSDDIKTLDSSYSKEEQSQRLSHEFSVMVTEINAFSDDLIEALGGVME
jgi:recombination associated protein RdgC